MEGIKKQDYRNEVIITAKYGNKIKIIFAENDNKDVVDVVLDNLMTSYEKRIGA